MLFRSNLCLSDIQAWMTSSKLKLNPDKTEFILIGSASNRIKLSPFFPVTLLDGKFDPSDKVRNLGVIFDRDFSFSQHVSTVCRSCFYYIRDLCRIRRHLSRSTATTLANALVTSRLDYCNSLFFSLTKKQLKRLQNIQNTLCRIVTHTSRFSSVSGPMRTLHWLPVEFRIIFKTNLISFKALHTGQPLYIKDYLSPYTSVKQIRRSNPELNLLATPHFDRRIHKSKVHLSKSFCYSAPRLWNSLPLKVRTASTLSTFRSSLKTHLFSLAYPP